MTVYSIASLRERRKEIIDDYQARLASCRTRYDELRAAVIREGRPLSDGVKGGRQVTRLNATLIQACRDLDRLEEEDLSALRDRRAEELGLIDAALVLPRAAGDREPPAPITFAQYEVQVRPRLAADAARRAVLFGAAVNLARQGSGRPAQHELLDEWAREFDSVNHDA